MPSIAQAFGSLVLASLVAACAGSRDQLRPPPDHDPMQNIQAQQLFEQGVSLSRSGDLVRAEQYFLSAMQRGMPDRQVLPQLMGVCVAAQRFRAAIAYADPYLERHPSDWRLRFLVGTIRAGLGETQAARRDMELVLELTHDEHANAHYMLATMLRDSYGDAASADAHFRRYLALEPSGEHAEESRAGLLRDAHPTPVTAPASGASASTDAPTAPATPVLRTVPTATPAGSAATATAPTATPAVTATTPAAPTPAAHATTTRAPATARAATQGPR